MIQPPMWISPESWSAFVESRRAIRAPLTDYAAKLIVIELARLKSAGENPQACLDQSIRNGWRDVFRLRDKEMSQTAIPDVERTRAELDENSAAPQADPEKRRAMMQTALRSVKRMA